MEAAEKAEDVKAWGAAVHAWCRVKLAGARLEHLWSPAAWATLIRKSGRDRKELIVWCRLMLKHLNGIDAAPFRSKILEELQDLFSKTVESARNLSPDMVAVHDAIRDKWLRTKLFPVLYNGGKFLYVSGPADHIIDMCGKFLFVFASFLLKPKVSSNKLEFEADPALPADLKSDASYISALVNGETSTAKTHLSSGVNRDPHSVHMGNLCVRIVEAALSDHRDGDEECTLFEAITDEERGKLALPDLVGTQRTRGAFQRLADVVNSKSFKPKARFAVQDGDEVIDPSGVPKEQYVLKSETDARNVWRAMKRWYAQVSTNFSKTGQHDPDPMALLLADGASVKTKDSPTDEEELDAKNGSEETKPKGFPMHRPAAIYLSRLCDDRCPLVSAETVKELKALLGRPDKNAATAATATAAAAVEDNKLVVTQLAPGKAGAGVDHGALMSFAEMICKDRERERKEREKDRALREKRNAETAKLREEEREEKRVRRKQLDKHHAETLAVLKQLAQSIASVVTKRP